MTDALNVIRNEHGTLWRVLGLLDDLNKDLKQPGHRPNGELLRLIFHYLGSYADQLHHPKEDDYLFAALARRNESARPLIDELQAQHREGAELMEGLKGELDRFEAGKSGARESFTALVDRYLELERTHINTEEGRLMPLARRDLTGGDWEAIDRAFADNADPLFGDKAQGEFQALHRAIAQIAPFPHGLGMARPAGPTPVPEPAPPLLEVRGLTSHYGRIQALRGIDLEVREGELVALVGANGAGKTTLLRTLSGLQPASGGTIRFQGQDITRLRADKRVGRGICQSPEGRQVFGPLSVRDNLLLGAYSRGRDPEVASDLERMYRLFPILQEKRRLAAGTLSGGQQQMLAIGRALMGRPKLLLLDEPSLGLAPLLVEEIFAVIKDLKARGVTLFLVEQNAQAALTIADRGYVMETGQTVLTDRGPALLENQQVRAAYLGI